jgi:hypothetical protein
MKGKLRRDIWLDSYSVKTKTRTVKVKISTFWEGEYPEYISQCQLSALKEIKMQLRDQHRKPAKGVHTVDVADLKVVVCRGGNAHETVITGTIKSTAEGLQRVVTTLAQMAYYQEESTHRLKGHYSYQWDLFETDGGDE